jgi:hypothetical protein
MLDDDNKDKTMPMSCSSIGTSSPGRILEIVGVLFPISYPTRLVMVLTLVFGMMYGVE